ncbi:5-formyltetrahydrofolate cyclo-ligase [Lichenibacterium dinghuense]|uniref:5-formyltetrahydrofolate cyclo-ligase n=1 Tax=Lichenibacterium dinghuense TaxID=2895977 RepID=UPI001F03015D|nr:5-formyltetrahydrofolate cyclo-ligase [Lichenibacterium sp. 6Y81]
MASVDKTEVRARALACRAAVGPTGRASFARLLAEAGLDLARRRFPSAVSVFLPIRGEPDTRPLLDALAGAGIRTALPATPPRGEPLRFRAWRPGDPLVPGRFGTAEPAPEAAERDPDLLFVPLAAFDRRGFRLGYGAGFYDGALARLRAVRPVLAVGVAFAAQEVPAVPTEPHDQPLDAVLTERGLTLFGD